MFNKGIAVLALCFFGITGCGGEGAYPPVTGEWSITLHPTGEPATDTNTSTINGMLLTERAGVISGYTNAFSLSGARNGDQIDLDVIGTDKNDAEVRQGQIQLTLMSADSGQGTGTAAAQGVPALGDQTKNDSPENTAITRFDVSMQRAATLTYEEASTRIQQAKEGISDNLQGIDSTICRGLGTLVSFAVGQLTGNALRPMGGCLLKKNGGGYYLFGRDAPGSIFPIWTQNVYMPVEFGDFHCASRNYKFTFSYDGQAPLATGISLLANSQNNGQYFNGINYFLTPGAGIADLAQKLDSFRSKYGNYAFIVAAHPRTRWVGLYVIRERGSNDDVKKEAIVKSLAGSLNASVMVGKEIHDTFSLRRSLVPGACGDFVTFAYLIGTAKVNLD